jgi:NADH:ubiquinone oxidoreductase subunit 4 (subunit M)
MIRMYQRAMHNRAGADVAESREMSRWDFGLIAPLVAVIIALGVYPNFVLTRSEKSTVSKLPQQTRVIPALNK